MLVLKLLNASEIEDFKLTGDRDQCPAVVAKVCVPNGKLSECGDAKERRERQIVTEKGMVWYVSVI